MTRTEDETLVFPFADLSLARRLERAEGLTNAWFVEARAALDPQSGAEWIEHAGAQAMFDAVGSPLTQSFGLGMSGPVGLADLERLESFFEHRGAEINHEICPLADVALPGQLADRGYRPIEFSNVLYRPISPGLRLAPAEGEVTVRRIEPGEEELWARISAEGWSESPELAEFIFGIGRISAHRAESHSFLAELEDQPIAAGGLSLVEGVALLAGASTIPSGRRRGAQRALLDGRLRFAAESGCDVAMMVALPGSTSQRNAERQGFRIAYTRTKWMKAR